MELRLKYPPTVDNASKFAADMVVAAAEISGANLDFSVASLQQVDQIIEGLRRNGCTSDQIAETLFGFGCYVGEVFVRNVGGNWRNADDTSMANFAGFPLVIELGDQSIANPIGKVFKRLENGEEDSLPFFYHAFTSPNRPGSLGGSPPHAPEPLQNPKSLMEKLRSLFRRPSRGN